MLNRQIFNAILFLFCCQQTIAQSKVENLIVITTDGFRWQEVFRGIDTAVANDRKFNEGDSAYIYNKYGGANASERREKLLPFIWTTMAKQGQLYGNRLFETKVDVANPYWFSYPGYNEIFTGFPDKEINSNDYPNNPHTNVLEFFQHQPGFKNKIAAFAAWNALDRILNKERSGIPVFAAFDSFGGKSPSTNEKLLNNMLADSYKPWGDDECLDVFTHYAAMEYLKNKNPRILYVSYGETDDWAHAGKYRSYLDAAHQVDQWVKDIWDYVQSNPKYRNKTALLITVDHGRGEGGQWTTHGSDVAGASQIWFGLMGPGINAKGEVKQHTQLYQKQFAQTMANLLGLKFTANHPIADKIEEIWK